MPAREGHGLVELGMLVTVEDTPNLIVSAPAAFARIASSLRFASTARSTNCKGPPRKGSISTRTRSRYWRRQYVRYKSSVRRPSTNASRSSRTAALEGRLRGGPLARPRLNFDHRM